MNEYVPLEAKGATSELVDRRARSLGSTYGAFRKVIKIPQPRSIRSRAEKYIWGTITERPTALFFPPRSRQISLTYHPSMTVVSIDAFREDDDRFPRPSSRGENTKKRIETMAAHGRGQRGARKRELTFAGNIHNLQAAYRLPLPYECLCGRYLN